MNDHLIRAQYHAHECERYAAIIAAEPSGPGEYGYSVRTAYIARLLAVAANHSEQAFALSAQASP